MALDRRRRRTAYTAEALASAARTTTSQGSAVQMPRAQAAKLTCTARSGSSPTLDVVVQESPNGSTGWVTIATFPQINNTGSWKKAFRSSQPYQRIGWTVGGGTPNFTFKVDFGDAEERL